MNHSKPKDERKGRDPSALKAVGGRYKPETTLPTASHKEETETVRYTTESRTCTLEGRRQSAAIGTQAEESQLEVTEDAVIQVLERPYSTSYFLSGKLEERPVKFLVDTGCTTNLLSMHVFDRLPERVSNVLEKSDSHGIMADGTQLPFYGVLRLPLRVRDVKAEEVFVVSRINENVILGMPFLVAHNCALEFNQPIVQIDGKKLKCTDGRLLESIVQVTHELVVPPRTEMTVPCRVTTRNFCPVGVTEGQTDGLPIATSLNRPGV